MEKVFTESPFLDSLFQILVGGGYQTDINRNFLRGTDRTNLSLLQGSFITLLELGTELLETSTVCSASMALRNEETEKEHILEALRQTGNNKSKAAQLLNIDRKTLYNKLKLYNIDL